MGFTRPRLISFGKNQGIFQITYYFLFSLSLFFFLAKSSNRPPMGITYIFFFKKKIIRKYAHCSHKEEIVPLAKQIESRPHLNPKALWGPPLSHPHLPSAGK
ncbi:LOW QUALITY PROTEIN: hypothetical protein TorRG33x02_201230 [Trema orientale]|uniref:Transmembrane protein n=1 Tax=Trema orientale TaxID=63057 RepID=A0A2P5EEZ0_TREOI|nr:LOW QUALITY PROTEIN: hypothetical protein TorRG33x02_201230 [Trema orientale]